MRDGGQLVVECLKNFGATKAFGVPGESYLPILNALHDTKGELDFITCRQEGGAAFMAAAWGKLTGEPGICMVTRGPGATNASIGVHTAKQDSVPMILIVGQVSTDHLGREAFQEVDYGLMFRDLAKWVVQIDKVDRIPELMSRAWKTAVSGRPGPVVVVLPEDVLSAETFAKPLSHPAMVSSAWVGGDTYLTFYEMMEAAERPLILYGGGGLTEAGDEYIQAFAEANAIPVVCVFRYQDRYDNMSPTYVGEAGVGMPAHVRATLEQSDLILAIGPRFGEMTTGAYEILQVPKLVKTLIHVHHDAEELGKVLIPTLGIQACPLEFTIHLDGHKLNRRWTDWCGDRRQAHQQFVAAPPKRTPVDMGEVTAHLQYVLPEDVIITNGAGNFAFWPNKIFQYGTLARLLAPQAGAMGYGLPAAIAAKVHDPSKTIVCFAGDGDFQMTCQELATARQHDACPIILLINNGRYGTIRIHQEREYPGRVSGTDMWNPDFVALAQAYGFHAEKIEKTENFPDAFDRALESKTGALLELIVDGQ